MERDERTNFILKQFRKKSKKVLNKDIFTEFFYINKERRVVEFLTFDSVFLVDLFLKKFLPDEFKDFVSFSILNDQEEEVKNWYYDDENLVLVIGVNWGLKKQEISVELNIDNFIVNSIDEDGVIVRGVDSDLLNDYIISFLTTQAENLAKTFEKVSKV